MGINHSQEMIDTAKKSDSDVAWVVADAPSWTPDRSFHAIFSNAAVQWFPDP